MSHPIDLYELMPAVYRREDAGLGLPLEALLDIISTEAGHIQRNITDLWDDFFVETAAEWVIPYIADLVGNTPLHNVAGSRRADVAKTIYYRRRKGTVAMLEELAADVTGWGAKVVPFFELLEWSQYLDHLRREPAALGRSGRVGTVHLGDADALDRLGGPFDAVSHSADIRPFEARRGRHNIKKIGFFLWRLKSNPLYSVTARSHDDHPHGFHFSPLGHTAPLFTNDEPPPGSERPVEADLPGPVRPLALRDDLAIAAAGGGSRYYGPDSHHSMAVAVGDPAAEFEASIFAAAEVTVCNLSGWGRPAAGKKVAIDPARGRLTLAEDAEPKSGETVRVSYSYGWSGGTGADLGGGPYDRRAGLSPPAEDDFYAAVAAVRPDGVAEEDHRTTVGAAVSAWLAQPEPEPRAVVEIFDSGTYAEPSLDFVLPAGGTLELRARNRRRPVLDVTTFRVAAAGDGGGRLVVDGCAVLGAALAIGAGLAELTLRHCTLVPGRAFNAEGLVESSAAASLLADGATACAVTLADSVTGPVRLPAEGFVLTVSDSFVDSPAGQAAIAGPEDEPATAYGPTCDLRRVTVFGDVRVRSLAYASEVIFTGAVETERLRTGCVRFSYVGDDARTPRRYRCQPDLALTSEALTAAQATRIRARLTPRFTSRRYGQPGYGQLAADTAAEIRSGAENESEMGAFNRLLEPQRIANLRIRLDEYLPAGLEAGLIYET